MSPSLPSKSTRGLGAWWIAVACGNRYFAMYGDGRRESWATDKIARGPVFGVQIGRVDYDQ